MMNNLDELENLARGAAEVWDGNSEYHFRMSDCGPIVAERMGRFCDKANPETVLKLIAVARAAEGVLHKADTAGVSHKMFGENTPAYVKPLRQALAALEEPDD